VDVTRKETDFLARQVTRWWSAPARFQAATLGLLRKAAARRQLLNDAWVRQTPNGIRA
jgi:hypothetical protein